MQVRSKRRTKRKTGGRPRFVPMDIDSAIQRSLIKRSEKHWKDTADDVDTMASTWEFYLLNGIAQGDDYFERQGDVVTNLIVRLRYGISLNPEDQNAHFARVVILHDAQANGAAPTGATVFSSDSWNKFANHGFRQRFTVLYDKTHSFGWIYQTSVAGAGNQQTFGKVSVKIPKKLQKTRYSGTGNTITSIASGSIYLAYVCSHNEMTSIFYDTRLVYTDN